MLAKKYGLPDGFKVKVRKAKSGGFYAFLPDYPGCTTQGDNIFELIQNVNDAILTYFEVPRKDAEKAEIIYLPTKCSEAPQKKRRLIGRSLDFNPVPLGFCYG